LRHVISISLVLLLLLQCMGHTWLHQLQLGAWQHAQWELLEEGMREGRQVDGVVIFTVADQQDLTWENAHEFRHQGQMYDVLRLRLQADGRWEVRCVSDAAESRMKADFKASLSGHDIDPSRVPIGLSGRLLTTPYTPCVVIALPDVPSPTPVFQWWHWAMGIAPAFPPEGHPPAFA
jgi:hypothetical protein